MSKNGGEGAGPGLSEPGTTIKLQTSRRQRCNHRWTPAAYVPGVDYWASGCPSLGTRS